jgi:hypothetical protein
VADKKFKQSVVVEGDITSTGLTASRALVSDANKKIVQSATTATELGYVSGVTSAIQTQLDAKVDESREGQSNGIATLDAGGKIPSAQLPSTVMEYKGNWDASANSPTLADGTGDTGDVYRTSVAGTRNLGSGSQVFAVGDWVVYNGTIWQLSPNSNAVGSVFGRVGTVVSASGDYTASQVTNVAAGTIAAVTVQAAINELDGDAQAAASAASTAQTTINNHISNATGAHAASAISNTPAGGIIATTVQAAINELDSEKFNSADFGSTFNTNLATKTTSNLTEGTNLYFTDERAQDAVGTILTDSTTIDFSYTDLSNTISAAVITQQSITSDASGIKLSGDSASPGNNRFYGTNGSGVKGFYVVNTGSVGDIAETSFSLANNQVAAANVTGLAFSSAVRSFEALVSVEVDAASDLFEVFKIYGIRRGADWQMSVEATGDDSLVAFTITSGGQVTYTSGSYASFVSATAKFRAITTTS